MRRTSRAPMRTAASPSMPCLRGATKCACGSRACRPGGPTCANRAPRSRRTKAGRSPSRWRCARIRASSSIASTRATDARMNFRLRLASFFVVALVVVQGLTAVMVYRVTRQALIGEGQRQLDVAVRGFARQLDDLSARVAASVQVLALDYALRSAIAQRDQATLLSALRNHGRRVGATRMLLVDVDGRVEADTAGRFRTGAAFPFDDLVARAYEQPASAIAAWDGRAFWVVVVPVSAPDLVGFIAAAIPVDD